jgi:hypothetical protein
MLRLTRGADKDDSLTIKLEGKLSGPWVDEVRRACAAGEGSASRISLDLAELTFVDAGGKGLLRELIAEGMEVISLSSYVAELLRSEAARPQENR